LAFAKALRGRWWLAAVPTVVALALVLQFVIPYLATLGTHPVRNATLRAEIRELEQREHAGTPLVRVQTVSDTTRAANAYSIGIGGTRDPAAARGLFKGFSVESLQDPTPPGWVHVFLDDHPTVLQRIELARAWAARNG